MLDSVRGRHGHEVAIHQQLHRQARSIERNHVDPTVDRDEIATGLPDMKRPARRPNNEMNHIENEVQVCRHDESSNLISRTRICPEADIAGNLPGLRPELSPGIDRPGAIRDDIALILDEALSGSRPGKSPAISESSSGCSIGTVEVITEANRRPYTFGGERLFPCPLL